MRKKPKKPKKGKNKMSLPGGMVWEVRRGSSGSGGYDLAQDRGTDYSQQDSPQISDPGDWEFKNNDYDRLYSATENLNVAAYVDNTILITGDGGSGAFTPGTYHIPSVGSDGDGDYIDLDRDAGTANAADGNGVLGGAADIEDIDSKVVAGNKVYIEYDATDYSPSAGINFSAAGSNGNPIIIIGYNASRDDDPIAGSGDQPNFAMGANYFQVNSNTIVKHISVETTTGAYAFYSAGTKVWLVRCTIANPNVTASRYGVYLANSSHLIGCKISCTNGRAIRVASISHILFNKIHDSNEGILAVTAGVAIICNAFDTITTDAVPGASALDVLTLGNTFHACGDAITGDASFSGTIINNIFHDGTDGIDLSGAGIQFIDWNNFWGNGGDDVSNATKGDNTTAVDPDFDDAGGGDFGGVDQTDAYVYEIDLS